MVAEVIHGLGPKIPNGKYVKAKYGAITKPLPHSEVPEDMETIKSDAELVNVIKVTSGTYKPIMVKVQIITVRDEQ